MITTVTLNASIDKAYELLEPMTPGTVMRVKEVRNTAGGKGLNVARIVHLCQMPVLATGFAGGFNGQYLEWLLEKDGIPSCFTPIAGETRSCINVLEERYQSTEFLEPGSSVSEEELAAFYRQFEEVLAQTSVVTFSGSLPAGVPLDTYQRLIELAKKAGKLVLLDSSGEAFREGLKAQPTLVKPNKDEIEALFGVTLHSVEETLFYAQKIADQGIDYVVVSLGGDGAVLLHDGKIYRGQPPKIQPVNTVGCGDSMVGALAVALAKGQAPEECLRYAIAVGTANALSPYTGHFEPEVLAEIYPQVQVSVE